MFSSLFSLIIFSSLISFGTSFDISSILISGFCSISNSLDSFSFCGILILFSFFSCSLFIIGLSSGLFSTLGDSLSMSFFGSSVGITSTIFFSSSFLISFFGLSTFLNILLDTTFFFNIMGFATTFGSSFFSSFLAKFSCSFFIGASSFFSSLFSSFFSFSFIKSFFSSLISSFFSGIFSSFSSITFP